MSLLDLSIDNPQNKRFFFIFRKVGKGEGEGGWSGELLLSSWHVHVFVAVVCIWHLVLFPLKIRFQPIVFFLECRASRGV